MFFYQFFYYIFSIFLYHKCLSHTGLIFGGHYRENLQLIENNGYPVLDDAQNNNDEKSENRQVVNSDKAGLLAENPQPTYWQSGKAKCSSALTTIAGAPYTYFYNPIKNMTVTSYRYGRDKIVASCNYSGEKFEATIDYFRGGDEQSKCQGLTNALKLPFTKAHSYLWSEKLEVRISHKDAAKRIASDSEEGRSVDGRDEENAALFAKLISLQESGKATTYFIETSPIQERTVNNAVYFAKSSYNKVVGWYYGEQEKSSMPAEASYSRVSVKDYVSQDVLTGMHSGISMMLALSAETTIQSVATLFHSFAYGRKSI